MPRVLLAQLLHETNTFSTRPASLVTFRQRQLLTGQDVLEVLRGTNTEVAGFIAGALAYGWDITPVIAAEATPCGRVDRVAWEYFRDELVAAVHRHAPVDIVLLALHGAMVSEGIADADGAMVAAVRAATGPHVVIGCTLDLHANPSSRLARAANVLVPFVTYPHLDMRERGEELVELAHRASSGTNRWRSYVFRNRQLDGCDHGRSTGSVMPRLVAEAGRASVAGSLRVGVCAGFPWADVPHAGPSVVVSGPLDHVTAAAAAEPLLTLMWDTRGNTSLVASDPLSACARAREMVARGRRVLIADYSDNPGGGGYGTTTAVLSALLARPGAPAVMAPICDPHAALACAAAGIGAEITVTVGSEPEGTFSGPPLRIAGKIMHCRDTSFRALGPLWQGLEMHLGMTARVSCGPLDVVITSYPLQVTEPSYLESAGVDVESRRIIAIKSLQHFRANFEPLVDDVIFADSGGLVSNQYDRFPYRHVRRPIWPLDPDAGRQ